MKEFKDKVKKVDISTQVFEILLNEIKNGRWKAGDKLPSENDLIETLNVSRVSIRSAVKQLVGLNVVETIQGKGSFVKEISTSGYLKMIAPIVVPSSNEIMELLEYRKILEIGIMEIAIERGEIEHINMLEIYVDKMKKSIHSYKTYAFYDTKFHITLFEMTKNKVLISSVKNIWDLLEKSIRTTLTIEGAMEGIEYNDNIINAIRKKDVKRAESLMAGLLSAVKRDIEIIIKNNT